MGLIIDIIIEAIVGSAVDAAVKRARIQRAYNILCVIILVVLAAALIYFALVPESL